MKHLHESFDYNHEEGCLRWKALNDEFVYIKHNGKVETTISPMSRMKPGAIAGSMSLGSYSINQHRESHCGLRMIWQYVTGELVMGKIRTMNPRDTRFSIDNLYVVPFDQSRVHRDRAKNSTVVSYCFEHKQFTTVAVDHDYNKTIIGYYGSIEDAFKALVKPEVSFL
mgnify:CR=1 FL=1|tara:strand:- start:306 stop:809 length:504 start_codon:yes stop_codon:yes gene_type:complete